MVVHLVRFVTYWLWNEVDQLKWQTCIAFVLLTKIAVFDRPSPTHGLLKLHFVVNPFEFLHEPQVLGIYTNEDLVILARVV